MRLIHQNRSAVGTIVASVGRQTMGDRAQRFRDRGRDCLNLAKGARHRVDRIMLEEIGAELEAEAKVIDAEERTTESTLREDQSD